MKTLNKAGKKKEFQKRLQEIHKIRQRLSHIEAMARKMKKTKKKLRKMTSKDKSKGRNLNAGKVQNRTCGGINPYSNKKRRNINDSRRIGD